MRPQGLEVSWLVKDNGKFKISEVDHALDGFLWLRLELITVINAVLENVNGTVGIDNLWVGGCYVQGASFLIPDRDFRREMEAWITSMSWVIRLTLEGYRYGYSEAS